MKKMWVGYHAANDILFFVDNTSGRLHTNLTQLKTKLRKFVRYDGKVLYSIDLTNSQPFLLQSLLEAELFIKNKMEEKMAKIKVKYKSIDYVYLDVEADSLEEAKEIAKNGTGEYENQAFESIYLSEVAFITDKNGNEV